MREPYVHEATVAMGPDCAASTGGASLNRWVLFR